MKRLVLKVLLLLILPYAVYRGIVNGIKFAYLTVYVVFRIIAEIVSIFAGEAAKVEHGFQYAFERTLNFMRESRLKFALSTVVPFALFMIILQPEINTTGRLGFVWSFAPVVAGYIGAAFSVIFLIALKNIVSAHRGGSQVISGIGSAVGSAGPELDPLYDKAGKHGRKMAGNARRRAEEGSSRVLQEGVSSESVWADIENVLLDTYGDGALGDVMESILGEGAAGEAMAGEAGAGGAIAAGPVLLALIAVLAFNVLIMSIIAGVIYIWFLGIFASVIGTILSPVMEALGLGSDYSSYVTGSVSDNVAGVQFGLQDEIGTVMEARQRVYCLLQGPACLRQWRLNNTRNPGSESVGEEYKLQIDRLEIGSGEELDVAYKNGDYKLPVSFGLSNARNGLKGINAYNVSYRLRMIDSGRNLEEPYCDTGWSPINGYNIRNADGDSFSGNDLYPGTAANTGFLTLNEFSLKNCGLLQPGSGETKTVVLEVKYDYFSQATLYFDAMARQTLLSDSSIQKEWKQSETADTPVKSAINVNSPVIYNQDALREPNQEAAQPFSMRAELYTEDDTVEYKIRSLKVRKSSEVDVRQGSEQRCMFEQGSSEDILVPGNSAGDIISGEIESNSGQSQDDPGGMLEERDPGSGSSEAESEEDSANEERWFSSSAPAPFFGCTMTLTNPEDISPGGETLTMGVESNYTVKLSEQLERFDVLNSRCSEFNCPLLVTKQFVESEDSSGRESENWRYKCEGPDAAARSGPQAGCAAVKGDPDDWSTIELLTGSEKLDKRIERREIAIDPAKTDYINNVDYSSGQVAIGLTETENERLESGYYLAPQQSRYGYVLITQNSGERDTVLEGIEEPICDSNPESVIADRSQVEREQIVGYETTSCQSGS